MASTFSPGSVLYPVSNLQHMFDRHKGDWGFAGRNWNNATKAEFQAAIVAFITTTSTVNLGTYRGQPAWLVVDTTSKNCAIVLVTGTTGPSELLSGWKLSDAQFTYATTSPYSLGGGALVVFGNILENIINAETHDELDKLTDTFFDTYKAHGTERYDEKSEESLIDFFAVLDCYVPPHMRGKLAHQTIHIESLHEVKKRASQTLAVLEKMGV